LQKKNDVNFVDMVDVKYLIARDFPHSLNKAKRVLRPGAN